MIGVTGATGNVGGRVARLLAKAGHQQRLVARDPSRLPELPGAEPVLGGDYDDLDTMTAALTGVDTLFLVSAKEAPDRVARHKTAIDAARAAGVSRVVYLSFLSAAEDATFTFARDHWATEVYLRASGLDFTFLRQNLYLDLVPHLVQDGVIKGPAGQGRCSFVARDDVAAVAAAILPRAELHRGRRYDVTGPEALSLATVARLLGVDYVDQTVQDAYGTRDIYGAPAWEVEGWVTSYQAIGTGELSAVSHTVERATGHHAKSLEELLSRPA
ncbi:SDR family oxidoreductase [Actinocorallia sp. API 0066]|uniref:SDR family oxidoreductase n=1 Tax=Actinocorallia sp. API 0066 TaxID=2896846 RepID=UPI001E61D377|nr:SDR family oxidoreductase [Actinocorallia sp. API 0066]MCD0448476.1 SDR family oxidoreductase [Actinocorallia sp. API 0066]